MAEAGCDAVKLEGGAEMADRVAGIVRAGIPVIGHLGLTPQSVSALGGFRLAGQGRGAGEEDRGRRAGARGGRRVLHPAGDGAGPPLPAHHRAGEALHHHVAWARDPHAHGQLLIYHDAFGLYPKFTPRMAKVFADAGAVIRKGLAATSTR